MGAWTSAWRSRSPASTTRPTTVEDQALPFMASVDRSLYLAKQQGRNRIVAARVQR